jgi:hypothetical protein
MAPGIAGAPGFTIIVIVLLTSNVGNAHGAFEVICRVTTSPLFKLAEV